MKIQLLPPKGATYDPLALGVFVDGERMHGFCNDRFTRGSSKQGDDFVFNLVSNSTFVEKLVQKLGKAVRLEVKYDARGKSFDFGPAFNFHGPVEVVSFCTSTDREVPIVTFMLSSVEHNLNVTINDRGMKSKL